MKKKANFDRYLEAQMRDSAFAERFKKAGEAWDVAMRIGAGRRLKTSQQRPVKQP